ncbi:MAG: DNA-protecting protein DprA [Ignavibacteria bacterium]|nr:DNA-protecting protein DprA [Ignavibacteria bacterium]
MSTALSDNARAILLLTAPLISGRNSGPTDLLTPGEYKRLARHLHSMQREPADLLSAEVVELLQSCGQLFDESRLRALLDRGFLLSQVIERWHARAIWVVSRADAQYPRLLKERLREDAPSILYGCGDIGVLENGGLAVVGSRHVDDPLIEYAMEAGRLAARAGRTLVSGGAKGIDQAAMRGALEAGGKVSGVLSDSLERTTMNREHRNLLLNGEMVLLSPYDPNAGFNVGNAMQRNKLIYALADAALVVSSDLDKGGTWSGAVEQLRKYAFAPVYVRSTGEHSEALDALRGKGALPWPNPQDADALEAALSVVMSDKDEALQPALSLFSDEEAIGTQDAVPPKSRPQNEPAAASETTRPAGVLRQDQPEGETAGAKAMTVRESVSESANAPVSAPRDPDLADTFFTRVREVMLQLLKVPLKEAEVAAALDLTPGQTKVWLQRLLDDGSLEKLKRPTRYVRSTQDSLLRDAAGQLQEERR